MKSSSWPGTILCRVRSSTAIASATPACLAGRGGRDGDVLDVGDAEQLLLHRGVRHEDLIVHVLAHALALGGHDADHLERLVADADDLADRIRVGAEQLLVDGRCRARRPWRRAYTSCGLKNDPILVGHARIERQVDIGSLNAREPVLVAGHDLRPRLDARRRGTARRAPRRGSPRRRRPSACSTAPSPCARRPA